MNEKKLVLRLTLQQVFLVLLPLVAALAAGMIWRQYFIFFMGAASLPMFLNTFLCLRLNAALLGRGIWGGWEGWKSKLQIRAKEPFLYWVAIAFYFIIALMLLTVSLICIYADYFREY